MFKRLFQIWKRGDLTSVAFDDAKEMLCLSYRLFHLAVSPIFEKSHETLEQQHEMIYTMDANINQFEMSIRRKILEDLSIAIRSDISAALILITIAGDIERLGDYSKNFFDLRRSFNGSYSIAPFYEELKTLYEKLDEIYQKTLSAFDNSDSILAHEVMKIHTVISSNCDDLVDKLLCDNPLEKQQSCSPDVLSALTARYIKRISAHLKNITSSIVNPYDRIGYTPNPIQQ